MCCRTEVTVYVDFAIRRFREERERCMRRRGLEEKWKGEEAVVRAMSERGAAGVLEHQPDAMYGF